MSLTLKKIHSIVSQVDCLYLGGLFPAGNDIENMKRAEKKTFLKFIKMNKIKT